MKIILNDVEYTAPAPKTGLWFAVKKIKTAQAKRVAEIQKVWGRIQPFDGRELTEIEESELNTLMADCINKTEENKQILLDEKIKIIVMAFNNPAVTIETILEHLPLLEVSLKFAEIELELNDIASGRVSQFPNEPAVK